MREIEVYKIADAIVKNETKNILKIDEYKYKSYKNICSHIDNIIDNYGAEEMEIDLDKNNDITFCVKLKRAYDGTDSDISYMVGKCKVFILGNKTLTFTIERYAKYE